MFLNCRIGNDDPARLRAYANFKGNLEDILRAAQRAGVPVILSTVAVNLKDCAPFASIHAAGLNKDQESAWNKSYDEGVAAEAAGSYQEALALIRKPPGLIRIRRPTVPDGNVRPGFDESGASPAGF